MSNYKYGDIVNVIDGSYTLSKEENGRLRHATGVELFDRDFEVIDIDLDLPTDNTFVESKNPNNMIIKARDNNQLVYIQERFVKPKTKLDLVQVSSDDWHCLYLNGEKLIEGHSIYWEHLLDALNHKGIIKYQLHSYELTEKAVEDLFCEFPQKVSDYPEELNIL